MKNTFKTILSLIKSTFKEWWEKDPFRGSAVIAYYAILALPGLLIVVITIVGYFYGEEAVNGKITGKIASTIGANTAEQIQDIIARSSLARNSILATILGLFTIFIGATGVFVQFQKSLNSIWHVEEDSNRSGFISMLRSRIFSFGLIIALAFILLTSLILSAAIATMGEWVIGYFSENFLILITIVNYLMSIGILSVLFAIMFKFLPDVYVSWRHVWIGSFVTTILFEIGKAGLGLYFGNADPSEGYGAAGSIILILLWVSYTSMIVFLGAEFTYAYSQLKKKEEHDALAKVSRKRKKPVS